MSDDGGLLGDWLFRYRPGSAIWNQESLYFFHSGLGCRTWIHRSI